ncbi:hypothetical protein H4S06_003614, partial [Coemansia sp. BCRC 34490]
MAQKRQLSNGCNGSTDSLSSASDSFPPAEQFLLGSEKRDPPVVVSDSSEGDDEPVVLVDETNTIVSRPFSSPVRQTRSREPEDHNEPSLSSPSSSSFCVKSGNKRSRISQDGDNLDSIFGLQRSFSQPAPKRNQQEARSIATTLVDHVPNTAPITDTSAKNNATSIISRSNSSSNVKPRSASNFFGNVYQKRATKLTRAASAKGPAEADVPGSDRQSYLQIFDRILHTVLRAEAHLFSDQERQQLSAFSELDRHSRYLFTRVYMRKREWLRVSALDYGGREVVDQSCKYLGARKQNMDPFFLTEADIPDCEKALALLLIPELRALAKSRGLKQLSGKPKEALCAMIMKSTKQRTIVSFFKKNTESQAQRAEELVSEIIGITGPMVCLNPGVAELFERLHMVFFRAAVHVNGDNTMKLAVLATIGQIRFPKYTIMRSSDLFVSAQNVIEYKALVEIGAAMAELAASPVKLIDDHKRGWELYLAHRESWTTHVEALLKDGAGGGCRTSPGLCSKDTTADTEQLATEYWRRHFTPGWALSRIVVRGAKFAATLKQYKSEEEILISLLSQRTYQLHKRGEWYERLILLYTTHLRPKRAKGDSEAQDQTVLLLKRARETCIRAIQDRDVNTISLHAISKQLGAVEEKLELEERFQFKHPRISGDWQAAPERTFHGVRIKDNTRRGPSLWDGDDQVPCSVEELALWRYRALGFHGIHSENSMATTLFSLLFWDIIFHPVMGVLDTEYQSHPLDMMSDAFYTNRRPLIDRRLEQIAKGDLFLGSIQ